MSGANLCSLFNVTLNTSLMNNQHLENQEYQKAFIKMPPCIFTGELGELSFQKLSLHVIYILVYSMTYYNIINIMRYDYSNL